MTEPLYPRVERIPDPALPIDIDLGRGPSFYSEDSARLLHARLGAVLGAPAPAPSEPLAWVVFSYEDGDLRDQQGNSVDYLVYTREEDAQDCADDGRHDGLMARRIVPLYPAAPAQEEARLDHLAETLRIIRGARTGDWKLASAYAGLLAEKFEADGRAAQAERVRKAIRGDDEPVVKPAARAEPAPPGGEEGRDG